MDNNWQKVKKLEDEVSLLTGAPVSLCVNSNTSGLMLALRWFGVGCGDEVIIPAYTYSATALAVLNVGAKPIMVDVNENFNISVQEIENAITTKTKAIIPVDFGGFPCDYEEIQNLALKNKHLFKPNTPVQKN